MYDQTFLHKMYQQWLQGNDEFQHTLIHFVEMAARYNNVTTEVMLEQLKKYNWFKWKMD